MGAMMTQIAVVCVKFHTFLYILEWAVSEFKQKMHIHCFQETFFLMICIKLNNDNYMIDVDDLNELTKEDLIEIILFLEQKLNKVEDELKNKHKHVTVRPRHIFL